MWVKPFLSSLLLLSHSYLSTRWNQRLKAQEQMGGSGRGRLLDKAWGILQWREAGNGWYLERGVAAREGRGSWGWEGATYFYADEKVLLERRKTEAGGKPFYKKGEEMWREAEVKLGRGQGRGQGGWLAHGWKLREFYSDWFHYVQWNKK